MAKKKKTALKPVVRGFATTSQAKKVIPEPSPEETAVSEDDLQQKTQEGVAGANGAEQASVDKQPAEGVDWEDDAKLEEGVYQGYVERLQDKGDREVAKILKVSRYDDRPLCMNPHRGTFGRPSTLTGEQTRGTSVSISSRL